jgi:hypothetical protein
MVVDWIDYYNNVVRHGSKPERIIERIHNCVNDFYGPEIGNEITKKLKFYILNR